MDWKDKLAALSSVLPEGEVESETPQVTESEANGMPKQNLLVEIERKGRGGKVATIISGFTCAESYIDELSKKLKKYLGVGGSCRGGEILLQGDQRDKLCTYLTELGHKAKRGN